MRAACEPFNFVEICTRSSKAVVELGLDVVADADGSRTAVSTVVPFIDASSWFVSYCRPPALPRTVTVEFRVPSAHAIMSKASCLLGPATNT